MQRQVLFILEQYKNPVTMKHKTSRSSALNKEVKVETKLPVQEAKQIEQKVIFNHFQCCEYEAKNIERGDIKNAIFSAASAGLNLRTRRRASNEREGYTAGTTTSGKDVQDHDNNDKGSCTNYIDYVDNDDDDHAHVMPRQ